MLLMCNNCKKQYNLFQDSFSVKIDEEFVKRFGFEEYFNKAHNIFLNPIPHPVYLTASSYRIHLKFSEGIGACPYCNSFEIIDPEPYNNAFIKSITEC